MLQDGTAAQYDAIKRLVMVLWPLSPLPHAVTGMTASEALVALETGEISLRLLCFLLFCIVFKWFNGTEKQTKHPH